MTTNWRHNMPTAEAYWLDKVLYELHHNAEDLARYRRDPNDYLKRYPLSDTLRRAILENDVAQLYLAGVNPYLLRAHCIGIGIPEDESLAALHRLAENAHG